MIRRQSRRGRYSSFQFSTVVDAAGQKKSRVASQTALAAWSGYLRSAGRPPAAPTPSRRPSHLPPAAEGGSAIHLRRTPPSISASHQVYASPVFSHCRQGTIIRIPAPTYTRPARNNSVVIILLSVAILAQHPAKENPASRVLAGIRGHRPRPPRYSRYAGLSVSSE